MRSASNIFATILRREPQIAAQSRPQRVAIEHGCTQTLRHEIGLSRTSDRAFPEPGSPVSQKTAPSCP